MGLWKALRSCVVAVAIAVSGCSASAPPLETTSAGPIETDVYRLGSGDNLRVIVFGQDQLSGQFAVDGSGRIAMPLVGEVMARGLTPRELEASLSKRLAEGYIRDPKVSVEVLNFRPFYIIGEVNKPGQYPYASGMTALSAVAAAGGFTYRGRQDYVLITRTIDGRKVERSAPPETPILPDDVIRVPERFF